jgi:hypothetical protein
MAIGGHQARRLAEAWSPHAGCEQHRAPLSVLLRSRPACRLAGRAAYPPTPASPASTDVRSHFAAGMPRCAWALSLSPATALGHCRTQRDQPVWSVLGSPCLPGLPPENFRGTTVLHEMLHVLFREGFHLCGPPPDQFRRNNARCLEAFACRVNGFGADPTAVTLWIDRFEPRLRQRRLATSTSRSARFFGDQRQKQLALAEGLLVQR